MINKFKILSGVFGIVCSHLDYLHILTQLEHKDVTLENSTMARARLPHLSVIFFMFDEELSEPRQMNYDELCKCVENVCITNRLGECEL